MNERPVELEVSFDSVVPHFTVPDVVRAAEFYRDALGFEIAGYWDGEGVHHDPDRDAMFAIVQRDRVRLHFNRADVGTPPRPRADQAYDAYFHVHGIDALADDLRRRSRAELVGPEDRVYGQRELLVEDCNGLLLAFGERIRGSRGEA